MNRTELGVHKPCRRKFIVLAFKIVTAEHTKLQHALWCQFRIEARIKLLPYRHAECIGVLLSGVMDMNCFHGCDQLFTRDANAA